MVGSSGIVDVPAAEHEVDADVVGVAAGRARRHRRACPTSTVASPWSSSTPRQLGVVLEGRLAVAGGLGLGHPELDAVELAPVAVGGLLGVGDAVPGGHEVELAGPDDLIGTEAVAVQDLAGDQPGDGLEAGVGVGADADAVVGVDVAGPMWSTKHHAPTVRRSRRGSARRTFRSPTTASWLSVTSTPVTPPFCRQAVRARPLPRRRRRTSATPATASSASGLAAMRLNDRQPESR